MVPTNRIVAIDCIKALLIAFVVLGHSIQWTDVAFLDNGLFRRIYAFHMPAFMFISGYLYYKESRVVKDDIIRIVSLFMPYCVWLLLWPGERLWFLRDVALFNMVFAMFIYLSKRKMFWSMIFGSALMVLAYLFRGEQIRLLLFPFFVLGYICRARWHMLERFVVNKRSYIPCVAIAVVCLISWDCAQGYVYKAVRAIIAVSMTLGLFGMCMHLCNKPFPGQGFVRFIGASTLGIYAIHYTFLSGIKMLIPDVSCATLFCITMLMSLISVAILNKIPVIRFLLLGNLTDIKRIFRNI